MLLIDLIEGVGQKTQRTKGHWVPGKSTPLAQTPQFYRQVSAMQGRTSREKGREIPNSLSAILLEEHTNDVSAECTENR